jgi:hypothetical protein
MVTAMVVLLTVLVAVLGVLVIGLLRSHAEILRRLHDLGADVYEDRAMGPGPTPVGLTAVNRPSSAPERTPGDRTSDIQGVTPAGRAAAVSLVGDTPSLLAFLSSGCTTCADIWAALDGLQPDDLPVEGIRIVAVTRDATHESPAAIARLAPAHHTGAPTSCCSTPPAASSARGRRPRGTRSWRSSNEPEPTASSDSSRRVRDAGSGRRGRHRHGGGCRDPLRLVALRGVDAVQHPPAR